jgi:HD domain
MSASDERAQAVERLVIDLGVAFQNRNVYPSGHPALRRSVERAIADHRALLALAGEVTETTLLTVEGQLLVDRVPVPEDATWGRGLLLAFERHEIAGLTLLAGLDGGELAAFLDSCHGGGEPQASRHVLLGSVSFVEGSSAPALAVPVAVRLPPLARPEELAEGREDFAGVAAQGGHDGARSIDTIDRLRGLVAALARAAAGAQLESPRLPTVNAGDREFLHGLAVALGALRLGRALGVEGDSLHDLGLAGLFHDIGRLVEGDDALSAHPVTGAARLAATPGVPPVAVLVAFEHHLRFDGAPSYPPLDTSRRPSAAAQLVAVADSWDTLRSRGRLPAAEAAQILRQRAGGFLNPELVEVFTALIAGGAA